MLTIFLNSKATGPFWKLLKNLWIIRYICVNSKWPKSTLALLVFFNLPSFWKWHSQMFICKCWNIYHMEFLITSDTDMLLKQDHVSIAFRYFDYQLFIRSHLLCRPLNMGKLGHVYYGGGEDPKVSTHSTGKECFLGGEVVLSWKMDTTKFCFQVYEIVYPFSNC